MADLITHTILLLIKHWNASTSELLVMLRSVQSTFLHHLDHTINGILFLVVKYFLLTLPEQFLQLCLFISICDSFNSCFLLINVQAGKL